MLGFKLEHTPSASGKLNKLRLGFLLPHKWIYLLLLVLWSGTTSDFMLCIVASIRYSPVTPQHRYNALTSTYELYDKNIVPSVQYGADSIGEAPVSPAPTPVAQR